MHRSDESELVSKILGMAGINMNKLELAQASAQHQMAKVQQEKA